MTTTNSESFEDRSRLRGGRRLRAGESPGQALPHPQAGESITGSPADPFQPLVERGVSREVWEAQGVAPYYGRKHPLHDADAFRREFDAYGMTQGQRTTLVTFANSARGKERDSHGEGDGLLMHKRPFPGEPPILPQLRPRYAVRTGSKKRHDHAKAFAGNPAGLVRHLNDPLSEHGGIDLEGVHVHDNFGKYLVTPAAREDHEHDHATDKAFQGPKGRQKLRAHLRAHHGGRSKSGLHKHRRRAHGQNVANRFNVNPLALERFAEAEVVASSRTRERRRGSPSSPGSSPTMRRLRSATP